MMYILYKMKQFFSLDVKIMLLFFEAFLYLGWARILIFIPFSKVSSRLGMKMQETRMIAQDGVKSSLVNIQQAIQVVSKYTFWESKCLVQAIAGMKMLERRQIESTLYLGTTKDEKGKLIAHAWLRSGTFYITGAEVMNQFVVVGTFAKQICNIEMKEK